MADYRLCVLQSYSQLTATCSKCAAEVLSSILRGSTSFESNPAMGCSPYFITPVNIVDEPDALFRRCRGKIGEINGNRCIEGNGLFRAF